MRRSARNGSYVAEIATGAGPSRRSILVDQDRVLGAVGGAALCLGFVFHGYLLELELAVAPLVFIEDLWSELIAAAVANAQIEIHAYLHSDVRCGQVAISALTMSISRGFGFGSALMIWIPHFTVARRWLSLTQPMRGFPVSDERLSDPTLGTPGGPGVRRSSSSIDCRTRAGFVYSFPVPDWRSVTLVRQHISLGRRDR